MLDHPEKTARLLAALKTAVPFEVELAPALIEHLQTENVAEADRTHHVSRTSRTPATKVASCVIWLVQKKKEEHLSSL